MEQQAGGRVRTVQWWALGIGTCLLLFLRLPFLPTTFEDIDSLNFDLGVHAYDLAAHQPHPPGFPLYIVIASVPHGWFESHAAALAAVSAVFGALAAVPLYLVFRELAAERVAAAATLFTVFNPLVWFTSVRPMSDSVGLGAAVLAQCLALIGLRAGRWWWYAAAGVAGLAGGVRIQTLVLTCPMLVFGCARHPSRLGGTLGAFAAGLLVWLLPLLVLLGGPDALLEAFVPVVGDVLAFESVAHRWNVRAVALALIDAFITPWHSPILSGVMLISACAGAVYLARTGPRALVLILVLYGPYAGYHLLLQDAQTIRYALPIVPLVAFLAATPLGASRRRWMPATVGAVVVVAATVVTLPALRAYHSEPSPAARALAHIAAQPRPLVVAGHYLFDRYLPWLDPDIERLPSTPHGEWRTLAQYWRSGRQEPVYFLRHPQRMTLLLFGRDTQSIMGRWSWAPEVRPLLKGTRPAMVELVRMDPPRWLAEEGFMARFEDRFSGVEMSRHSAWLRPGTHPRLFIASGELAGGQQAARLSLHHEGRTLATWNVGPQFTVHGELPAIDATGYTKVSLDSSVPFVVREVWFERADRAVARPGRGFYVAERDADGTLFRWTAGEATADVYLPDARATLTVEGEATSAQLPLTIHLEWNGRPLTDLQVTAPAFRSELMLERPDGQPWGALSLRVSRTFVPDEASGNGDRRTLGVRITRLSLSADGRGDAGDVQRLQPNALVTE